MRCQACGRQTDDEGACRHEDCGAVILSFTEHATRARQRLADTHRARSHPVEPSVARPLSKRTREIGRRGVAAARERLAESADHR